MMVILVIAIVVVGPKDLPKAVASISRYIRKARAMAREFQSGMDQLAKDTEFDEIQKDLKEATDFDIKNQLESAMAGEDDFGDVKPEIIDDISESTPGDSPAADSISEESPAAAKDSSEVKAS